MKRVGLAGVVLAVLLLTMAGTAWAEATTICVPERASTQVLSTNAKGECPTKTISKALVKYKSEALPGPAELEKLDKLLPHVNYVESGVGGKPTIQFSGVNVQIVNGAGETSVVNGAGNLIIGYDENEFHHAQTGSHDLIVGEEQTFTSYGGLVGGTENTLSGPFAAVLGGNLDTASGVGALASGQRNTASGSYSTATAGYFNHAEASYSSVSGGEENIASGNESAVSGGLKNAAVGKASAVSGGQQNASEGEEASVGGGRENVATGHQSAVSGGWSNIARGATAVVAGGQDNTALGEYSVVAGGRENRANSTGAAIDGGAFNTANTFGTISGSLGSEVLGKGSWIGGGIENKTAEAAKWSAVFGGKKLEAKAEYEAIP